ncbi:MAG: hypothetical protein BRD30_03140 [Bacteroidetes bacterium QH_2_63_10]|nr:MAG: hypothetical protein BRD30_03140 [Bacteroidetes bacterium QH_2_63_10]
MPDSRKQLRQYVGLAVVIVSFFGGIIGWGWAALSVDSAPSSPDTTETRAESSLEETTEGTSPASP